MAVPFALMAAGTALQVIGNMKANYDQAKSELQNAAFYREQANLARSAMFREEAISARRYSRMGGAQTSAYARGGVDLSGSVAGILADTVASKLQEMEAIRMKGEHDIRIASLRGSLSESNAANLKDPLINLLQGGTVLTSNMAKGYDFGFMKSSEATAASTDTQAASPGWAGGRSQSYLGDYNF